MQMQEQFLIFKEMCPPIFVLQKSSLDRNCLAKGQLISKGLFDVIILTKKPTMIFFRISALASIKRSDQKDTCALYH